MIWKIPVHGVAAETKKGARMIELHSSKRGESIFKYKPRRQSTSFWISFALDLQDLPRR